MSKENYRGIWVYIEQADHQAQHVGLELFHAERVGVFFQRLGEDVEHYPHCAPQRQEVYGGPLCLPRQGPCGPPGLRQRLYWL